MHTRRLALLPLAAVLLCAPLVAAAPPGASALPALRPAVTVGTAGNEPLVRVGPDGTMYVSALQHLYVSRDDGQHWTQSPGSLYTTTLQTATDSSIQVDSRNRLYMTFDYPYAGTTAVCTSDDHAATMQCNPAVVPGGTDRMWLALKDDTTSYLVTNEALVQTVLAVSSDRGKTYVPAQTSVTSLNDTGDAPLLVSPKTGAVVQDVIDNATNVAATTNFESGPQLLRVFDPAHPGPQTVTHPAPLTAGGSLPGAAYGTDGMLYVTSEKATRVNGVITHVGVQVARSADDGVHWTVLPEVTGTTAGTSTFVALGAGRPGHVGLVYYRSSTAGDPGSVPPTTHWDAVYSETTDALDATPQWTTTVVDKDVHIGVICATAGCLGSGRFAGDFLDTTFDNLDRPSVVWMRNTPGSTTENQIRYTGAVSSPLPAAVAGAATAVGAVGTAPGTTAAGAGTTPLASSGPALADTGLPVTLPLVAAALLGLGWLARHRSVRRTHR